MKSLLFPYNVSLFVLVIAFFFHFGPGLWTGNFFISKAEAAGKILVSKKDKSPVRIAIYSGEGAYFRSIHAATEIFQWMGATASRITPEGIVDGKRDDFDILYMTGVHTEFEEGDERDNVSWDNDMHDPESERPMMLNVLRRLIHQDDPL